MSDEKAETSTGARASNPIRDAIYIVSKLGVSGARNYAERMPASPRWDAVREVVYGLNPRQTCEANLARLRRSLRAGQ